MRDAGRDGGGCVDGGALVLARYGDGGGVIALHLDGDVVGPCPLALSVGGEQGCAEQQRDDADGDRPDLPAGHWGSLVRHRSRSARRRFASPEMTLPPALFHMRKASHAPRQSPASKRRSTVDLQ